MSTVRALNIRQDVLIRRIRESSAFDDDFYFTQLVQTRHSPFPVEETMLEHYISTGHAHGLRGHPEAEKDALLQHLLSPSARTVHLVSSSDAPAPAPAPVASVKAIAFYLPQFHPIPENDAWWGAGFTEWMNVTRARPFFPAHNQPRTPADLGYYDLRVPEVRNRQAELAQAHGVYGFCYYFYWFGGKRLLFRPLDEMLASGSPDFPFCLCWANENWSRRWDGGEDDILIEQVHSPENDIAFCDSLAPYFADARYIRIDNRPLLLVYRPDALPDLEGMIARWREHFRNCGVGEVYLVASLTFGFHEGVEAGFDAEVHFPPHSVHLKERKSEFSPAREFTGSVFSYDEIVDRHLQFAAAGRTQFLTTMLEWDNTPRRGAAGHVFADFTVEKYENWLRASVVKTAELYKPAEQFVFINAWNEWGEGTYLEPDRQRGLTALAATARALKGLSGGSAEFIAEGLEKYPPTHATAASQRLEHLLVACEKGAELPLAVKRLFAKRRHFRIVRIEHNPAADCLCWLESLRVDAVVRTSTFELSGWTIAKTSQPTHIEVSIDDRVLTEAKIEAIRDDVYDYNGDFTDYRGPNAFLVLLNAADVRDHLRWAPSLTLRARVYGREGEPLCQIDLHVEQALEPSPFADCLARFQLGAHPAAKKLNQAFVTHSPILFVMHDIYPAGSQLFLIHFLRWLKQTAAHVRFELLVLLKPSEMLGYGVAANILKEELEALTAVFWLDEKTALPANIAEIEGGRYAMLYFNSIATLRHCATLSLLADNAIVHVHELDYVANSLLPPEALDRLANSPAQLIACSRAVASALKRWGAPEDRIIVHHSFTRPSIAEETHAPRDTRAELRIPAQARVVLLAGSLSWRKGAHLLSRLAKDLAALCGVDETPYFVWVGAEGEAETGRRIEYEFELLGLRDKLRLTGQRDDLWRFYRAADVFALTSLEDPFPLVMLEACSERLPVVAFEGSGGAEEFIRMGGAGLCAPMLDTARMAAAIHDICCDEALRASLREKAEGFLRAFPFEKRAAELLDIILRRRNAFAS